MKTTSTINRVSVMILSLCTILSVQKDKKDCFVVRRVYSITFHHQFSSSQNNIMGSIVKQQSSLLLEHTELLKENSPCSLHIKPRGCLLITRLLVVSRSQCISYGRKRMARN